MKEQQRQIIVNYVDSYNNFDVRGMTKDMDENVVFENISNGKIDVRTEGVDEYRKQAESAKNISGNESRPSSPGSLEIQ